MFIFRSIASTDRYACKIRPLGLNNGKRVDYSCFIVNNKYLVAGCWFEFFSYLRLLLIIRDARYGYKNVVPFLPSCK